MYFNRPAVKAEVKRSMRQTRPHPMLVTLLYLVVAGAGAWLISWLVNTVGSMLSGEGPSLTDIIFGIMYYGEDYLEYLLEYFAEMIVQAMMVSLVISILTTAWNGLMNTGYAGYCLNMCRDMNPPLEHIFSGFPRAGSVILAYILVAVFTFLWTMLFTVGLILLFVIASLMAVSSSSLAALGALLAFAGVILYAVGIIWVSYRYAMVPFILADSQSPMAALDAIRISKNMMYGRKGSFFVLQISFIGWYLLEYLIMFVGFMIAIYSIASSIGASLEWYLDDPENLLGLIYTVLSGGFWDVLAELFIPAIIVSVVCSAIIYIINLWLTPYRTGCEAHFYLYALGGGQPDTYGGQPGQYGGPSGPYGGQPNQYSSQPGPYGGQPSQYGSQPGQYGGQPGQYGGQPGQYGSQPGQYGSQPGQYGSQPGPYGGQPGQYGSQPSQYSSQPGPYNNNPYSYQPPSQSTSGGFTQESQPSQYGAAQWGAPQASQTPVTPVTPAIPEAPKFPETVIASVFDQAPAAPNDTPTEPDDAPYEAPYAEPAAPNDDDMHQQPIGPGDPQI